MRGILPFWVEYLDYLNWSQKGAQDLHRDMHMLIVGRYTLPRPSTTLQEARQALDQAAQTSSSARDHVETTQQQLLEALAAAQKMSGAAVEAVKHGWGWGNWAWWVGMEMLLVWGVFR